MRRVFAAKSKNFIIGIGCGLSANTADETFFREEFLEGKSENTLGILVRVWKHFSFLAIFLESSGKNSNQFSEFFNFLKFSRVFVYFF